MPLLNCLKFWWATRSLCVLFIESKLIDNKTELDDAIEMQIRLLFLDFDIFRNIDHKQKQIFYFSIKNQFIFDQCQD